MKYTLTLLALFVSFSSFAQDDGLLYRDHIYIDDIKSVKFYVSGFLVSMPILYAGDPTPLVLSFDDVSGDDLKDFTYTVEHYDADWMPSRLTQIEYVDGYGEERIENYEYSFKAKSIYTHYWVALPNEDMTFTKSGNYLLKVYEDEGEKRLAITRRFVVVDPQVAIVPKMSRPAMVSKGDTHQEIDFTVVHKDLDIRNPRQELTAVVLQNGRWDTAIGDLKPLFSRFDEQSYDYQDKIVFPAGKEFRYLDLRGVKYRDPRLVSVTESNGQYEAVVERDLKRGNGAHFERFDINGNFIIENSDERGRLFIQRPSGIDLGTGATIQEQVGVVGTNEFFNEIHNLQSEYIDVLFSLKSPGEMYGEDLYIFGGVSDWEFKPEFKMVYNPMVSAYVGKVKLKQGYYDYIYAAVSQETGKADFESTEGDWYETENEYTVLVYYRPFGSRFDQLIGFATFSSRF